MIERAIYICNPDDLKFFNQTFKRIYFGVEFCANLLPSINELRKMLDFCGAKKTEFTFVTPWCTEEAIKSVEKILKFLPCGTEVVFNDWGVWKIISDRLNNKKFQCVLGRLMTRDKNDPRVVFLEDKKRLDYTRQCALNNEEFQNFLVKRGINRVELSNSFQGYSFSLKYKIFTSFYYPYVFSSVTTKCMFKKNVNVERCEFACRDKYAICQIKGLNAPVITRGNTEFYKNDKEPAQEALLSWKVDRTVFTPLLPF